MQATPRPLQPPWQMPSPPEEVKPPHMRVPWRKPSTRTGAHPTSRPLRVRFHLLPLPARSSLTVLTRRTPSGTRAVNPTSRPMHAHATVLCQHQHAMIVAGICDVLKIAESVLAISTASMSPEYSHVCSAHSYAGKPLLEICRAYLFM